MQNLIYKHRGTPHFTKEFGNGSASERLVLPTPDQCNIKVTRFMPKAGLILTDVAYSVDETVYLAKGVLELRLADGKLVSLSTGDVYVVPAGVSYDINVIEDAEAVCVFSQAQGGPLPDND